MEPIPVATYEDRSIRVPPAAWIRTEYVPVEDIVLLNKTAMAIGDIQIAYQKLLCVAPDQIWPCPTGKWNLKTGRFEIHDGRHTYIVMLMLGYTHILVASLSVN